MKLIINFIKLYFPELYIINSLSLEDCAQEIIVFAGCEEFVNCTQKQIDISDYPFKTAAGITIQSEFVAPK